MVFTQYGVFTQYLSYNFQNFVADNTFNLTTGDALDLSEGSTCNSLNKVIEACFVEDDTKGGTSFVDRQIQLPTYESAKLSADEFLSKVDFPSTVPSCFVGALDGVHIQVKNEFTPKVTYE